MMATLPVIWDGRGLGMDDDPEADLSRTDPVIWDGRTEAEELEDHDGDHGAPLPVPPEVAEPHAAVKSQAELCSTSASSPSSEPVPPQEAQGRPKPKNLKQLSQASCRPLPGEAPPGAKYEEFDIAVNRQPGTSLGIDLSASDGLSLLVGAVKRGAIADWNLSVGLGSWNTVCRGDRFVEVNGIAKDTKRMIGTIKSDNTFQIKVRRLTEFQTTLQKRPGSALGFSLSAAPPGSGSPLVRNCLFVRNVDTAGLVKDHNNAMGAELELRGGDRVVEVNGEVGSSEALLEAFKAAEHVLQLHITRPPPGGWPADVFQAGRAEGW